MGKTKIIDCSTLEVALKRAAPLSKRWGNCHVIECQGTFFCEHNGDHLGLYDKRHAYFENGKKINYDNLVWLAVPDGMIDHAKLIKCQNPETLEEKTNKETEENITWKFVSLKKAVMADTSIEALKKAVDIIKEWHGDEAWSIYYNCSPEMKPIRELLKELQS